MTRGRLAPLPAFSGDLLVDVSDRDAIYDGMDSQSPILPSQHFSIEVETEGRIFLPPFVQKVLDLQPDDLLSVRPNTVSVRMDPYRDLLVDLQQSVRPGSAGWRYLSQVLQHPLTSVELGGSLEIPPDPETCAG